MQVASQHAETVGECAGIGVKKRLLLNGIALYAAHITPRHVESSTLVVADFTDTGLAIGNGTAMAACVTADAVAVELLVQLAFADVLINDVTQSRHRKAL